MHKLSDKESAHIIVNLAQPIAWIALSSNRSGIEVTEALVARAYTVVSCKNPLLRAVYKPEVDKFSLVIRDPKEIIQDETEGRLPAHTTKEFRTRDEAWAEYKRNIENTTWTCSAMWEVVVCILDKEVSPSTDYIIFGHFNHGATDGAAGMAALGEFVRVLNAGLTSGTLPSHDFLGESNPIPKPFHERYPLMKFDDSASDDAKEALFSKVINKMNTQEKTMHALIVDKSFTEGATQKFIAKCKANGVSVTAGLFACCALVTSAKKFDAAMPLSFRTKDNWGDVAVSFTDSTFALNLTECWKCEGEDAVWAAMAKEFHREIRKKFSSPEEKYKGSALGFVSASFADVTLNESMCTGTDGDELSMCLSNVGILDKYFVSDKEGDSPLCVTEVTGYCTNHDSLALVFWCYTFRGKFRISILHTTYPSRRKIFEDFADKVFKYIEKN